MESIPNSDAHGSSHKWHAQRFCLPLGKIREVLTEAARGNKTRGGKKVSAARGLPWIQQAWTKSSTR